MDFGYDEGMAFSQRQDIYMRKGGGSVLVIGVPYGSLGLKQVAHPPNSNESLGVIKEIIKI